MKMRNAYKKRHLEMIGCVSGRDAGSFIAICQEAQKKEDIWIEKLRESGVAAAHPDDGWVNRKENSVHFCYPIFDDGVIVGEKIALGDADKFRIVEVCGRKSGILNYWFFKSTETENRFISWLRDLVKDS